MGFGLLVSVVAEDSVPQGIIQTSFLLRCFQFRLRRVKSFCSEVLLWVWVILWSVKSFGFFLRHCETTCEFLYLHLSAVTHVHKTHYSWRLANTNVGFTVPSPLWRPSGGCKMLSILSSSGEKWHFIGLPKPGVLHFEIPVAFLQIDLYSREAARPSHTTVFEMYTSKVKISSAHSANFSLGAPLD